jgi:hypothetical protein
LAFVLMVVWPVDPARAADRAAAFLEAGAGGRAPGLGGALVAAVDDPSAVFWNPAGLARVQRWQAVAALQPLSLDRTQNSVAAALNVRGDLAFGVTWVHAGVDDLEGRAGSGARTGAMEDAENAFCIGLAHTVGARLAVGASMTVLDQRLAMPAQLDWPDATAGGHGFGLGFQLRLGPRAAIGAAVRNLGANLEWRVHRGSQQASTTQDPLPRVLVAGVACQALPGLLLTADLQRDGSEHAGLGAEWQVNPLLALRGGVARLGAGAVLAAGLTVRPMRNQAVQFHYAYLSDPLDAGERTVFGLGIAF